MIFLILAIVSSTLVSVFMRVSERYVKYEMVMFMANYVICMMLSFLFMDRQVSYGSTEGLGVFLLLGIVSGLLYLVSFVFLKFNMKQNGIVMASTFMKLGVLIPTVMAIIVFREVPRVTQIIGIFLSLTAIVMIHFEKDALKESNKKIFLVLLLLLSGLTDSMANIFEKLANPIFQDAYLLLTFGTACMTALFFIIKEKGKFYWKDVICGIAIGFPNYFSSRFLLRALGSLDAVLVYPVYSVGTMIVIIVTGLVLFREKLSKKKACALAMIVTALCLLNV